MAQYQSQQPAGSVFGGDEVGALVFDIGSHVVKAGFAGEDSPKAVFPSTVGCTPLDDEPEVNDTIMNAAFDQGTAFPGAMKKRSYEYSLGTNAVSYPKPGMQMRSPFKDGLIDDWDLYEELLNYTYANQLRTESCDHPLMMSECPWNTEEKREKLTEILFEKYKVPAMYLCKSAVLSAFAAGRSTALVFDGGASNMSVTPVYDGFVLSTGIQRSPFGGNSLSKAFVEHLENKMNTEIVPPYKIKSKTAVGEHEPAKWVSKSVDPMLTKSFETYSKAEVVKDFQAIVGRIATPSFHEETLTSLPTSSYEFPNGYNGPYGLDRYVVPEMLFDVNRQPGGGATSRGSDTVKPTSCHELIQASINKCDVDIRSNLWSSIIMTGGVSNLNGFADRLNSELQNVCSPTTKFKVIPQASGSDRQFSPWVGGSILASLGSFQQMWVSRQEYDESGKGVVKKKCV